MTLSALIEAYRGGDLTRDELFASLTMLLSADPGALRAARAGLSFDSGVRSDFEAWLQGLANRPQIRLGGRGVAVTSALVSALAPSDECPTLAPIDAEGATSSATQPVLSSRTLVQFMEARSDA